MENLLFLGVPILKHIRVRDAVLQNSIYWLDMSGRNSFSLVKTFKIFKHILIILSDSINSHRLLLALYMTTSGTHIKISQTESAIFVKVTVLS